MKADADGVYFLNVFAEAQGQFRTFSVRLDMGQITQKMIDIAMPANGELADGGKIRVLEAEEAIKERCARRSFCLLYTSDAADE